MKKTLHFGLPATLLATAVAVVGVLPVAHAQDNMQTREQRMDEALQNHRSAASKNPQPGPVARAEESVKRGARNAGSAVKHGAQRTGEAIKHGAQRTGQAIGTGVEKAGNAMERGGEKLKDKSGG